MIVVDGQLLAGGVGQLEQAVQRGIEPPRIDFRHDRLAGAALEAEHVPVARPVDPAVDDDRQRHLLGRRGRVVRLLFQAFRQRVHREGHDVGEPVLPARTRADKRPASRCLLSTVSLAVGQIPTLQLDGGRRAGRAAQREDAGHERQLAHGDAIDEILAAAVERVVDRQHVLAVLRDLEEDHRVGLEAVVVAIRHFLPLRVVERQHRLEPAGHGVGNVGDQLPRLDAGHQALALAGLEAIAVHAAERDLAVHRARQRDAGFLVQRSAGQAGLLAAQHVLRRDRQGRLPRPRAPGPRGRPADWSAPTAFPA